jgi:putative transposase
MPMQTEKTSYKRHRFPPQIIANVVWLCARFNLSLRKVEEMMLERGVLSQSYGLQLCI